VVDFGTVRQFSTQGRFVSVRHDGDVAKWGSAGIADLDYTLSATSGFTAPGGVFTSAAGQTRRHIVQVDTNTTGLKTGTLTIQSNAPDEPTRVVQLRANVVQFGRGGDGEG
jgi:hypothetical protein